MAAVNVFSQLKAEFEAAQKSLKDVDETIKKLTGRDPEEFRNQARRPGGPAQGAAAEQGGRERFTKKPGVATGGPPAKRRNIGGPPLRTPIKAPAEDSGDEEELPRKGGIQSSVVAAPAKESLRTRREVSALQKGDRKCMERNRRMFGMMLGTLQKFQSEETKRKDQLQSQKRAEIEQKLEEAAEREKAELRKERQDLFLARRQKQQGLRRLELKLEVARLHEEAEARQRLLLNFIHTRTKPHIMFKPARHTPETQKRLKESQKRILAIIESRRAKVKEELDAIDELYHRENAHPGEEEEEEIHRDKENRGPAKDKSADEEQVAADGEGSVGDSSAEPTDAAVEEPDHAGEKSDPADGGEVTEQATASSEGAEPMDTTEPEEAAKEETAGDEAESAVAKEAAADPESTEGTEPSEDKSTAKADAAADAAPEEQAEAEEGAPKEETTPAAPEPPSINVLGDEKFEPIYDE
ncbi:pinin [Dermacentor albipictus]|uniref:pinin n=1 Tax=Dermacentor albipictus TaxID=60249 RepID=UPI0038FD3F3A